MCYYTDFYLSIENSYFEDIDAIVEELKEITSYQWDNSLELECVEWNDWVNDMSSISSLHPNLVFRLEGQGEDPDDRWVTSFKNGKMQFAEAVITFKAFDERKLT